MSGGNLDLLGVNLAAGEFGSVGQAFGTGYTYPTHAEIDYEAASGMNVIRLPFLWERLQPTLNGPLDSAELARIDDVVAYATSKGLKVDLDVHDYGNYGGQPVGSAAVPNSAFADLWGKIAAHYATNSNVMFGLMNEPQQSSATGWLGSVNAAVVAIRGAGASQEILVPGIGYDGAWTWTTGPNASVIGNGVVDPLNNYAFEVHQYLDSDGSGTHQNVVSSTIGSQRLAAITTWAESTGHRLFLGEFGVSSDTTSLSALGNMLSYMSQHADVWQGGTYWAAGPWWGNYMYSAEPSNGVDTGQMMVLEAYKHTAPTVGNTGSVASTSGGTGPAPGSSAPTTAPAAGSTTAANPTTAPGTTTTAPVASAPSTNAAPVAASAPVTVPAATSTAAANPTTAPSASTTVPVASAPSAPVTAPAETSTAAANPTNTPVVAATSVPSTTAAPALVSVAASAPTATPAATSTATTNTMAPAAAVIPATMTPPVAITTTAATAPVSAAATSTPTASTSAAQAITPPAPLASDTLLAIPAAAPDAAPAQPPTVTVDAGVTFASPTGLTLTGTVSDAAASVHVLAGRRDLGAATVAADGTWALPVNLPKGFHGGIAAVAISADGLSARAAAPFSLTTGIKGQGYKASLDSYDANGTYLGTTEYDGHGGIYLQWTETANADGNVTDAYTAGSALRGLGVSSAVSRYDASGDLLSDTMNVLAGGTHTVAAAGGSDTFVFQPHHGHDWVAGFVTAGPGHDVLSLPASEFTSFAQVLSDTSQSGADTVIKSAGHDAITLLGVSASALKPQDFRFHP